jgi:hypothetical protein
LMLPRKGTVTMSPCPGMEVISIYRRSDACAGGISKSKKSRTQEYGNRWNCRQVYWHDLDVVP